MKSYFCYNAYPVRTANESFVKKLIVSEKATTSGIMCPRKRQPYENAHPSRNCHVDLFDARLYRPHPSPGASHFVQHCNGIQCSFKFVTLLLSWTVLVEMINKHFARNFSTLPIDELLNHKHKVLCFEVFICSGSSRPRAAVATAIV